MLTPLLLLALVPERPGPSEAAPETDVLVDVLVEVGAAAQVLYPPGQKDPRSHVRYGGAVSAALPSESRFKAMVGVSVDHVVAGWLGDPQRAAVAERGRYRGTQPASFRGAMVRVTPHVRLGIDNDFAYGYFRLGAGYALRTAALSCIEGPCGSVRSVDHGLNFGVGLGGMIRPWPDRGFVFGAEVGLSWAWFHRRHPALPPWNQGMAAQALVGWLF